MPAPELDGLVASGGVPFALADTAGAWRLVFFGYTHCPDVCPETIGHLLGVLEARPDARVIFVSIDPERDTPASMTTWTKYMPAGFIGVTGTPAAIARAADAYDVRYARLDTGSRAGYAMAHTADQYLIDGEGTLRAIYPFRTPTDAILADLERLAPG